MKNNYGAEKFNARFFIRDHRHRMKPLILHQSQTLQQSPIRIILMVATPHDFDVWTTDVQQAYLQSNRIMTKAIFTRSGPVEFGLFPEIGLQPVESLCALSDSGEHWFETLENYHRNHLGMEPLGVDPALCMMRMI